MVHNANQANGDISMKIDSDGQSETSIYIRQANDYPFSFVPLLTILN